MSISANFPNLKPSFLADFANSQVLDSRITFSRSTTAPYYDGKTSVLAEQNLQRYSQDFTFAGWQVSNITVGTGITAPDGTTTANSLTVTNATNYIQSINIPCSVSASTTYTASIYLAVSTGTTTGNLAITDTPAYSTTTQAVSLTTTWQRFTVTRTTSANATQAYINLNGFPNGVVVYVWGAQLEQRSSVTAYNATTTTAITNYIPQLLTASINSPRFDFNPTTGESLGLLIEQSSTNLCLYSSDYTQSNWVKTNATVTASANISPDGTQNMQKLVESTANAQHYMTQTITVTASTTYTYSIYAKSAGRTGLWLYASGFGTPVPQVYFDLSAGTFAIQAGSPTCTITPVGNGVYRCTITGTTGGTSLNIETHILGAGNATSYTGDGFSGLYLWGAQLE